MGGAREDMMKLRIIFLLAIFLIYQSMPVLAQTNAGVNKMNKEIKTEKAIFGLGCFWGAQEDFDHLPGVISTRVGFCGGTVKDPSYHRVCEGDTGHAEVVEIEYDPKKITYSDLLKKFFASHDPTTLNRQGPDTGYQYRSVIFYTNPEQEKEANEAKEQVQAEYSGRAIVTAVEPAQPFYKAEDYHQHYLQKRGLNVCH
jgi:peptide-methionine (S)-S-oxide reductase